MSPPALKSVLDHLYETYATRQWVHPDPLEFLYACEDVRDRELVGLIASSLAYGNVRQILRSVARVLDVLGPRPRARLLRMSDTALEGGLAGFRHRWTTDRDVFRLLSGVRAVLRRHGTIEAALGRHWHGALTPALAGLVRELGEGGPTGLLPDPARGSACKRLHLYLRWMVRCDAVDPGGWEVLAPSDLMVPLDVHMHRIARRIGFTQRRQANERTAVEVTTGFRALSPADPVRYDFALTRLGIQRLEVPSGLLALARPAIIP